MTSSLRELLTTPHDSFWCWANDGLIDAPGERFWLKQTGIGNVPVRRHKSLEEELGLSDVRVAAEWMNPTGSYKARGAINAASVLRSRGITTAVASSSGSMGKALAYCFSRAGIKLKLALTRSAARAKIAGICGMGAEVFLIDGYGDDAQITNAVLANLVAMGRTPNCSFQISAYRYCPIEMTGIRTVLYHIISQLEGKELGAVFVPVGSGGLLISVIQACQILLVRGLIKELPHIYGVQMEGCDTFITHFNNGILFPREVTTATNIEGLKVPVDIDASMAMGLLRQIGPYGHGVLVTDVDTRAAQNRLFYLNEKVDGAGAVALAAVRNMKEEVRGLVGDKAVVLVASGSLENETDEEQEEILKGVQVPSRAHNAADMFRDFGINVD